MMALNLSNFWPKIVLAFCLVAILNLAIVVPIAQAFIPVQDYVKDYVIDPVWQFIKTMWHYMDSYQWITTALNTAWQKRYQILKSAANYAAQIMLTILLNMITNDIVNWIKYGTKPRFITEGPWAYLKTATNNALGYFIDQYLGAGYLCQPFALDLKIMYSSPSTFQERARCNLSDMGRNLGNFTKDFRNGGWKTWVNLVNNNEYDAYFTTQEAWSNLFNKVNEENKTDYQLGNGFLSMKSCQWTDGTGKVIKNWSPILGRGVPKTPKDCKSTSDARKQGKVIGICHYQCRTETPSSVISSMANKVINEPIDRVSRAISNLMGNNPFKIYLTAIADAIIWRSMHEVGGLLFGGNPSTSGSEVSWQSDFDYNNIASSTHDINTPLPKLHSVREEAKNASSTITVLNSLGKEIGEKYQQDIETNLDLENKIQNVYLDMANKTNYVTSTEEQIINSGCSVQLPFYSDNNGANYPAWLDDIHSWQDWNQGRIDQTNNVLKVIGQTVSLIASSTRAVNQFVDSEKQYESACADSKAPLCDQDPPVIDLKKIAQGDLKTAVDSINKILSPLGGTSINSLSEASASLTNAVTNVANLDLDAQKARGMDLATNSSAHPQSDGSWSGTLWDQLKGKDITDKQTELDNLYSEIQGLEQECNL